MALNEYKPGDLASLFESRGKESKVSENEEASLRKVRQVFENPLTNKTIYEPHNQSLKLLGKRRRLGERSPSEVEASGAKKGSSPNATEKDKEERTIFVGNVPAKLKVNLKLKKFFRNLAGPVESVRIRSVPISGTAIVPGGSYKVMRKASVIKGCLDTSVENPACIAYVVFRTLDSVQKALSIPSEKMEFLGNKLRLDYANSNVKSRLFERKRTIFVGNLPFQITETTVLKFFEQNLRCKVEACRIIRDGATNIGKGFGYVLLDSPLTVEEAIKLNGKLLEGRELRISKCERSKSAKSVQGFQGNNATKARSVKLRKKKSNKGGKDQSKRKLRLKREKEKTRKQRKKENK